MSDLGIVLQKSIILDKIHDNVLARLSNIDNSGGNSENQTDFFIQQINIYHHHIL